MKTHLLLVATLLVGTAFGQINSNSNPVQSSDIQSTQIAGQEQSTRSLNANGQVQQLNNLNNLTPGQHVCSSHELNEQHYQDRGILQEYNQSYVQSASNAANLAFTATPNSNEISVIFHVVHNLSNPAENVSNAQIMALFQALQDDYQLLNADAANVRPGFGFTPADADINFCLATQDPFGAPLTEVGVVRVSTTEDYYDHDGGEENKMKAAATGGSEIWDRNKYLNVWICNITNGLNYGTAGYAYRPTPLYLPTASIDGIVIDYNIGFGSNVLTHEVGHYLGLDHTWGGSGGCGNDDSFGDTPLTNGPADQDPTFNCGMPSYQSCGVEVQYENYMDYATGCTVMFTQEQANYMLSILQGIRGSLLLSPGCDPTNTPPNSAFMSMPAGPSPVIIPENGAVSFIDQSTNVPTGWTWTISGTQGIDWAWINGTNQNSQDPQAEFYNIGLYDVTLTASNSYGADLTPASEVGYVQVVGAATGISCDTLRNWIPTDPYYYATVGAGNYIQGNSNISSENSLEWAERYTATATTEVKALEFAAYRVNDAGGSVIFKVYPDNAGVPGAVPLATETVLLADLNELAWNNIPFTTPATVTGSFWVGYELSYNATDTFALFTNAGNNLTQSHSWVNQATSGWVGVTDLLLGNPFYASLMDVLTSNGTAPAMNFTATTDEVCVGGDILVDGNSSVDNGDYRWYVTDDPWVTSLETSNSSVNTFNFPYAPGTYNIYLFGDGACLTDGIYLPVTVNANVAATVTPTATTCGNNNGSITVTGESGGDGTYYYSLDGVNYQVSNSFTGLAPGDYDVYVATLGDNCEYMQTVTVNTSSPGSATPSPGVGICPGGTANISVSGGVSWIWSDGASVLGTNAAETVTPATTTQYACLVTDGSGCQTTVYTTVTVNTPAPAPTISASGPLSFCSGSSVDLTSSYPTNNVWSTTETGSTITVSTDETITVTFTDGNGCLTTSAPTVVSVLAAPTISAGTVTDPTACGTATGSIEVSGSGTGDISWSGAANGSATGVALPYTIPTLAAGSYNITYTDANGCVSSVLSQGLNDPTPPTTPTITASGALTFCDGGSVTLTSSYGSGNTWSSAETSDNIVVTTSGPYSVTYTDAFGCSATSAATTVTVNPLPNAPTINASGALTFCEGGSVDLTSSQGTGNTWSTTESTQTITVSTTESVTLTYTNANGCSATSAATDITVNPLPTVTMTALGMTCDYYTAFALTGGVPAGGAYTGTGVTAGSFDPATAGLGTHTIQYEYTDGNGCTNTTTEDIVVDQCLDVPTKESIEFKVYPNPMSDEVNVEFEGDFELTINDAQGRLIDTIKGSDQLTINTVNYEAGVYILTINNNDSEVTTRIIKQ